MRTARGPALVLTVAFALSACDAGAPDAAPLDPFSPTSTLSVSVMPPTDSTSMLGALAPCRNSIAMSWSAASVCV
ncbi:MAG: hypothetical protein AAF594_09900 [Bacteroidota bacterium]